MILLLKSFYFVHYPSPLKEVKEKIQEDKNDYLEKDLDLWEEKYVFIKVSYENQINLLIKEYIEKINNAKIELFKKQAECIIDVNNVDSLISNIESNKLNASSFKTILKDIEKENKLRDFFNENKEDITILKAIFNDSLEKYQANNLINDLDVFNKTLETLIKVCINKKEALIHEINIKKKEEEISKLSKDIKAEKELRLKIEDEKNKLISERNSYSNDYTSLLQSLMGILASSRSNSSQNYDTYSEAILLLRILILVLLFLCLLIHLDHDKLLEVLEEENFIILVVAINTILTIEVLIRHVLAVVVQKEEEEENNYKVQENLHCFSCKAHEELHGLSE